MGWKDVSSPRLPPVQSPINANLRAFVAGTTLDTAAGKMEAVAPPHCANMCIHSFGCPGSWSGRVLAVRWLFVSRRKARRTVTPVIIVTSTTYHIAL
jgi:hypothetical protein